MKWKRTMGELRSSRNGFLAQVFGLGLLLGQVLNAQELLKSAAPVMVFEGAEAILKVAVSDDGNSGLIFRQDGSLRTVDFRSGRTTKKWGQVPDRIMAMALANADAETSRVVIIATERALWSSDLDGADAFQKVWETKASIYGVSLAPNRELAAVATSEGCFVLNLQTGAKVFSTSEADCPVALFSPDGMALAIGLGKQVRIYEAARFTQQQAWPMDFSPHTLAYAANSRFIAVGGDRETIVVKETAEGRTIKTLKLDAAAQDGAVVCFAGDTTGLFVGSDHRLVVFSGLDKEKSPAKTIKTKDRILFLAFSRASASLFAVTEGSRSLGQWGVALPKPLTGTLAGTQLRNPAAAPPALTVLSPTAATQVKNGTLQLTFKVSSSVDLPVARVRVLVDGRPARITVATPTTAATAPPVEGAITGPFVNGQEYTYQVAWADRDATLLVQAESRAATSVPVVVKLRENELARTQPKLTTKVAPPTLTLTMAARSETPLNSAVTEPMVELLVRVHSFPDQPVLQLKILVDGRPVSASGMPEASAAPFNPVVGYISGENYKIPVHLPRRDSTVAVIAQTAYADSETAVAKLGWKSQAASVSPSTTRLMEPPTAELPASGVNPGTSDGEGLRSEEAPLIRKADGTRDSDATRILDGPRQSQSVPLEVDANGRLRWQSPKHDGKSKPTSRQPGESAPIGVQILSPASGVTSKEKEILLTVKVGSTPGHDISKLQVLVEGIPVDVVPTTLSGSALSGPPVNGQVLKYRLILPPQDCQITVLAESAASHSKPATIRILRGGKAAPAGVAKTSGAFSSNGSVGRMAKPLVTITDPPQDSVVKGNTVRVGVRVSVQPGQAAPVVRILVDAQDAKADRAPAIPSAPGAPLPAADRGAVEEIQYFTVAIPSKDCTLMAYAETPYATSDPALLKLRWDRSGLSNPSTGLPTLYLLAVGVSKYKDKSYSLTYPAKDARDFADAMKAQKGKLYKDVVMKIHTDEAATRDNVMDDLEWIQRQATQQDMVIVFFAGHGINDTVTGNYYFLPHDANLEAVKRTMIPGSEIHSTLARLTGTRLLFMDTCHAGNITGTAVRGVPDMRQFLQDLKDGGQGLVVITSSRPGQKSQEHPSWKNGAFTKALVEGLKGKAQRDKQGFVTFTALDAYITQRVKELTNGTQAPTTQKGTEVSDFPLALVD